MVGTNARLETRDSRLEAKRGETVHKLVTEGARAREGEEETKPRVGGR